MSVKNKRVGQRFDQEGKLFNGFEFAVVSPVYSHSNTLLGDEDAEPIGIENDNNENKGIDLDDRSLQFINFLVKDSDE